MKKLFIFAIISFVSHGAHASRPQTSDELFYKRSFDLGLSTGTYNNISYTEADLGLNLYFNPHLDLRNALFGRFASGVQNVFGLDSSLRGVFSADLAGFGYTSFVGPGVRIPSLGKVTPFGEGGLIFRVPGFGFGGGAKVIANSILTNGASNETQVFIILAGGGEL